MALWYVESFAAMLLAFNRCVEVWSPNWAHRLFRDNLTWLWLSIVTLYAFVGIVFTTPSVFTSIHVSWFYNPHVGYIDDFAAVYNNKMHSVHNIIIALGLFSLYVVFCVTLVFKRRYYQERAAISRQSKMPFIQVFLITTVNMVASSIYVYMNFFAIGETLIIIGSLMWFFAHGIPAVIYLTMNNTIRKDCHKYLLILTKSKGLRGGAIMPKIPSVSGMLTSTRQNMVNAE
ncbi:serpentine type 7TM GPCR chemoreceptor srt domain-containing protein [Ditylenchus destructor]|nr:serpentine type 7TM GPCR chemoreceptor srt domain-containing protein [Ditylenchus destructor]